MKSIQKEVALRLIRQRGMLGTKLADIKAVFAPLGLNDGRNFYIWELRVRDKLVRKIAKGVYVPA